MHPALRATLARDGFVVFDSMLELSKLNKVHQQLETLAEQHPSAHKSGFFEWYHDQALADVRQSPQMYSVFAELLQHDDLWVVFDRMIHMTSQTEDPLPLHVDQNPFQSTEFCNLQGLLALDDCNEHTGMLSLVPKSHLWFEKYKNWCTPHDGWIAYKGDDLNDVKQQLISIPLRKGQVVVWDSRVTHSRVLAAPPIKTRSMMMISYMPANYQDEIVAKRKAAYYEGVGVYDHESGLRKTGHAEYPSLRQNMEQLTDLGQRLYGLKPWPSSQKPIHSYNMRVLLVAEEYGFGPASNIVNLFHHFRERACMVNYAGCGHTLELQKNLPYNVIFDMTSRNNDDEWLRILDLHDVIVVAMDFRVAKLLKENQCKAKLVVFDSLFWYWPELPLLPTVCDLYLAQNFFNVAERAQAFQNVTILGPLQSDWKQTQTVDVFVNFGGILNPDMDFETARRYVQLIRDIVIDVCEEYDYTYRMVGSNKLNVDKVSPIAPNEARWLLRTCKIAFMTPGLGNIYDTEYDGRAVIWLPPTNPSQYLQLKALQNANLFCSNYAALQMPTIESIDIQQIQSELLKHMEQLDHRLFAVTHMLVKSLTPYEGNIQRNIFTSQATVDVSFVIGKFLALVNDELCYAVPTQVVHHIVDDEKFFKSPYAITAFDELRIKAHLPDVSIRTSRSLDPIMPQPWAPDLTHKLYHETRNYYINQNLYTAHGICLVAPNNQTMLIVGPSGVGKTTLAIELCTSCGCKLFSGDKTILREQNNRLVAVRGTKTLTLLEADFNTWDCNFEPISVARDAGRVSFQMKQDFYTSSSTLNIDQIVLLTPHDQPFEQISNVQSALHRLFPLMFDMARKDFVTVTPTGVNISYGASPSPQSIQSLYKCLQQTSVATSGSAALAQRMGLQHIRSGRMDPMANKKHILYGICGLGSGHRTRAIPVINYLIKQGHRVTVVTHGKECCESLKTKYSDEKLVCVVEANNPYLPGSNQGCTYLAGIDLYKAADDEFNRFSWQETLWGMYDIFTQSCTYEEYDLVISDYEQVSAMYSYMRNIPLMTYDQQSKYLIGNFPATLGQKHSSYFDEVDRLHMFFPTADRRIAISFFKVPRELRTCTKKRRCVDVEILPPMIKPEILVMSKTTMPTTQLNLLVYLTNASQGAGDVEGQVARQCIWQWLNVLISSNLSNQYEHINIRMYAPPQIRAPASLIRGNVSITTYFCGSPQFYEHLEASHGVISTAGHMLLSECMFLDKPVLALAIPTLYEQQMNAKVIGDNRFGVYVNNLALTSSAVETFVRNVPKFIENIQKDKKKEDGILFATHGNAQIFDAVDVMLH